MLERKIEKGPFKGKIVEAETSGTVKDVKCKICGYILQNVTFFNKNPNPNDAGLCPNCHEGCDFEFVEEKKIKHITKPATAEEILKELKINPSDSRILKVLSSIVEERKKPKVIYTITTIKFGWFTMLRGKNKGKKVYIVLGSRVVGWFTSKQIAIDEVLNNSGDIYECGSYPTAVVEEVPMGLYPYCGKSWWFHWRRKVGYKPSRKPKSHKRVVNFAIG